MKSGTGELMRWLNLHPMLSSGKSPLGRNEVHFFDTNIYDKSHCKLIEYAKLFPVQYNLNYTNQKRVLVASEKSVTFDKSPSYIRNKVIRNFTFL